MPELVETKYEDVMVDPAMYFTLPSKIDKACLSGLQLYKCRSRPVRLWKKGRSNCLVLGSVQIRYRRLPNTSQTLAGHFQTNSRVESGPRP